MTEWIVFFFKALKHKGRPLKLIWQKCPSSFYAANSLFESAHYLEAPTTWKFSRFKREKPLVHRDTLIKAAGLILTRPFVNADWYSFTDCFTNILRGDEKSVRCIAFYYPLWLFNMYLARRIYQTHDDRLLVARWKRLLVLNLGCYLVILYLLCEWCLGF